MPSLTIMIAGLALELHTADSRLAAHIRQYYAPFISVEPAARCLELSLSAAAGRHPDPVLRWQPDGLYFAPPGFTATIPADLRAAHAVLHPDLAAVQLEYLLRVIYALLLLNHGGALFHAAGVVAAGRAWVFFGHSGSGKTTVTRLLAVYPCLNDDLIALVPTPAGWLAHATPFWNPTSRRALVAPPAPLGGLFRLVQAPAVAVRPLSPALALAEWLASVPVVATAPQHAARVLAIGQLLLQTTNCYRLEFLPDASFWPAVLDTAN